MNVKIYQIGGNNPEGLLGTAETPEQGRMLVRQAKDNMASGVSLHGTLPQYSESVSGEFSLVSAYAEFNRAERHQQQAAADRLEAARALQ